MRRRFVVESKRSLNLHSLSAVRFTIELLSLYLYCELIENAFIDLISKFNVLVTAHCSLSD